MMIVGIVATGTGVEMVRQFAEADSVADGLSDFVNAVVPPLDPADWLAFDSGWTEYQDPGVGMVWSFDRDTSTLVATPAPPSYAFAAASKMESTVVTSQSWVVVDGLVTNLAAFTSDAARALGKATGQVKVDGAGFEMRFTKGDSSTPISADYAHADTGGGFEIFGFYTNAPGDLGDQVYCLEARLNGAVSAEIRFASLSIAVNNE